MTPANPRPRMGWTISAAALLGLVVEPELVVVEPEPEVEDVLLDEWVMLDEGETVEEVLVDLRLAVLTVPLILEEPLPAEPVGTIAIVLFAAAGAWLTRSQYEQFSDMTAWQQETRAQRRGGAEHGGHDETPRANVKGSYNCCESCCLGTVKLTIPDCARAATAAKAGRMIEKRIVKILFV